MILDVNVLVYAVDDTASQCKVARKWIERNLTGYSRIGIPWQTISGFIRIVTNPRIYNQPLTGEQAWEIMDGWLASPVVWVPPATERTASIFKSLMLDAGLSGARVMDAALAAIAIEHGVPIVSVDSDFAAFPGVRVINPLEG